MPSELRVLRERAVVAEKQFRYAANHVWHEEDQVNIHVWSMIHHPDQSIQCQILWAIDRHAAAVRVAEQAAKVARDARAAVNRKGNCH